LAGLEQLEGGVGEVDEPDEIRDRTAAAADAPGEEEKYPSGDVTLPRPGRTPGEPLPAIGDDPTHPPTRPLQEDDANGAAHAATAEAPRAGRSHAVLYVLLVLLVLGAAGSWVYIGGDWGPAAAIGGGDDADAQAAPEGPRPWVPQSPGLPPELLDAGVEDAGDQVRVVLDDVPEGAEVRVDGITEDDIPDPGIATAGHELTLPAFDHEYVIEVRTADDELLWTVNHPAGRDGHYVVWTMSEAEIDAAAEPPPEGQGLGRRGP
ncbi:MAG: hypothetical protein ACODAG_11565, partial [Myxococcota bacterium]